MDSVRLRLVFNDHKTILDNSQKTLGLRRCWSLLKPEFETISDFESHLIHTFQLHKSCPNGLLLSMDGFVLPHFESTNILKDKDIIRVKKKVRQDVFRILDDQEEVYEVLGDQNVLSGVKLLALDEIEKENRGYKSEEEDSKSDSPGKDFVVEKTPPLGKAISKKRKLSKKVQGTKKRIKCSSPQKDESVPAEDAGNNVNIEPEEGDNNNTGVPSGKSSQKKKRSSKKTGKLKKVKASQVDDTIKNTIESMVSDESDDQHQENGAQNLENRRTSEGVNKLTSRSSRRKKAKRKWKQEQAISVKNETFQSLLPLKPVQTKPSQSLPVKVTDKEAEIVPIVVKPGHIRFEPLDEDEVAQRIHNPEENFQWNGSTNKKKGQKWGQEKTTMSRSNNYKDPWEEAVEKLPCEMKLVQTSIDFEKLKPVSSFPKEGDVVAYRVLELSSSWCPELSPFRVGKVSSCDSVTNRVVLVPVPEYPIICGEMEETDVPQVDASLYNDDGSLEIEFALLSDVRILNSESSHAPTEAANNQNEASVTAKEATSGVCVNIDNRVRHSQFSENGGNAWEEISQALNDKKTQLSKNNGWNKKEGSERSSWWTYRAMRSTALGPTMTRLRAGNELSA
ncbi:hypothetical protein MKW98_013223 [Papaver atlanticum]|uniref:Coilin n=1 Tax=Papaver atlanticum TaxID=357466 RepID=A0AAD4XE30_9MAGN|nr:hypothetical protein MKW98_013223 [Papaver atlanticum]